MHALKKDNLNKFHASKFKVDQKQDTTPNKHDYPHSTKDWLHDYILSIKHFREYELKKQVG